MVVDEACLENSFDLLLNKIHGVVGGLAVHGGVNLEARLAFDESVDKARECNYQSARLPFVNLFNGVYPAYLEAMAACSRYSLCDMELLAIGSKRCSGKSVVDLV